MAKAEDLIIKIATDDGKLQSVLDGAQRKLNSFGSTGRAVVGIAEPEHKTMIAIVKYHIATNSGKVAVNCAENCPDAEIIAKAKQILKNSGGQSFNEFGSYYIVKKLY